MFLDSVNGMMPRTPIKPQFIDLFAGCGGLSLGLAQGGWQGVFAIEKAVDAFLTFKTNLIARPSTYRFEWPSWLECKAHSIDDVLRKHETELKDLLGSIDLVAGGPPCQGFSMAGKRRELDPRNFLFRKYVQFVSDVRPKALVIENVPGMTIVHGKIEREATSRPGPIRKSYYEKLVSALENIGYIAVGKTLDAANFGVPQRRPRLIIIGIRNDVARGLIDGIGSVFDHIEASRIEQLRDLKLSNSMSARDAISDLVVGNRKPIPYDGPGYGKGFVAPSYKGPKTHFQKLMHEGFDAELMDSIRLARHSASTTLRFELILNECQKGRSLSPEDRKRLGMSKHRTFPMDGKKPAPTITTLPDDVLHYLEPRILSVRESARIQSFPDWFGFCGKYTTGGDKRARDCPRYTQVGNAVPPLMARAIGIGILNALRASEQGVAKGPARDEIPSRTAEVVEVL